MNRMDRQIGIQIDTEIDLQTETDRWADEQKDKITKNGHIHEQTYGQMNIHIDS
jgi:hypothetical protein